MSIKLEKIFVIVAFVFGMLLILLIPPLQGVDEDSHFLKSFAMANGQFFSTTVDGTSEMLIPDQIFQYVQDQNKISHDLSKKYSFTSLYLDSWLKPNYDAKSYHSFSSINSNPIAHIIPAFGMFAGKVSLFLMGMSDMMTPYNYLLFGRIFSLLFYIILLYYAIKITPYFKNLLFLLALMPMPFTIATSVSYDVPIIAISYLFIASILNLAFNEKVKKVSIKYLLVFATACIFYLNVKYVYLPLILLVIIVPREKFGDVCKLLKFLTIGLSSAFLFWIINLILTISNQTTQQSNIISNSSQQISFIIHNPFSFISILFNTIGQKCFEYFSGLIGKLGWVDTNFPMPFYFIFFYIILIVAIFEGSFAHKINFKMKLIIIVISITIISGIFAGLYIFWTSIPLFGGVGAAIIDGVQGRYFLPILPLVLLLFSSKLSQVIPKKNVYINSMLNYIPLFSVMSLIYTIVIVTLRFWI